MPTPKPIGRIHYGEPRAVMVRNPEDNNAPHSAIHCGVNVFTDNKTEADYIIKMWPYIMADLSNSIETHLGTMEK